VLAVLDAIATALEVPLEVRPAQPIGLHPARSADVVLNGTVIGSVGELHPDVAALFEISSRVGVLEIDLDPVVASRPAAQMQPVSTFPHVDFDLSFDVPAALPAADVVAATAAVSELVERADVFDEYRHPETAERSLAVRYRLRAPDRTLDGDEIATIRTRMIAAADGLGASLRGA
jgi:phenylalanyl-tRNA synthetase beta chain